MDLDVMQEAAKVVSTSEARLRPRGQDGMRDLARGCGTTSSDGVSAAGGRAMTLVMKLFLFLFSFSTFQPSLKGKGTTEDPFNLR